MRFLEVSLKLPGGRSKYCLVQLLIKVMFICFFAVKEDSSHTIGVEFGSRIVNVGGKAIKLQIWDVSWLSYSSLPLKFHFMFSPTSDCRSRKIPISDPFILPWRSWSSPGLRHNIARILQHTCQLAKRHKNPCKPAHHHHPCWQQKRSRRSAGGDIPRGQHLCSRERLDFPRNKRQDWRKCWRVLLEMCKNHFGQDRDRRNWSRDDWQRNSILGPSDKEQHSKPTETKFQLRRLSSINRCCPFH